MSSKITMDTTAVHCAAAIITGNPQGITLDAVAKKLALSRAYTKNLLSFARSHGLVDCVQVGRVGLWAAPADIQRVKAAHDTAAKARRRELQRLRSQRRSAAGYFVAKRVAARPTGRDLPDTPEVSRCRVDAPLPFTLRAPASVFHLGAML